MGKINKKLLFYSFIAISIIVVFIVLILPSYDLVKEKEREIKITQDQKEKIDKYHVFSSANLDRLKDAGWDKKKEIVKFNFVSSPFFVPQVHYFLRNLSFANGLIFSSITNSAPMLVSESQLLYKNQIIGPVKKTTFNFIVEGSYNSFKSLLSSLEKQARISSVKEINISPGSQKSEEMISELRFNVIIDFYSY
jgi:Tfp pilus assembly protein PilO